MAGRSRMRRSASARRSPAGVAQRLQSMTLYEVLVALGCVALVALSLAPLLTAPTVHSGGQAVACPSPLRHVLGVGQDDRCDDEVQGQTMAFVVIWLLVGASGLALFLIGRRRRALAARYRASGP